MFMKHNPPLRKQYTTSDCSPNVFSTTFTRQQIAMFILL
jgi:hypothetical protein